MGGNPLSLVSESTMQALRSVAVPSGILSVVLLCGCGGGGSAVPTASVSGTVTVKGEPLAAEGYGITFTPEDGVGTATLPVGEGGKFSGDAPAGKCKVTVIAVGTADGGHAATDTAGILEVYTADETTPLTADVKKDGAPFTFEVGE